MNTFDFAALNMKSSLTKTFTTRIILASKNELLKKTFSTFKVGKALSFVLYFHDSRMK